MSLSDCLRRGQSDGFLFAPEASRADAASGVDLQHPPSRPLTVETVLLSGRSAAWSVLCTS